MSADRYLPAAQYVAWAISNTLVERGLKPVISRIVLTETQQGNAWLFAVLEVSASNHPEDYTAPDLVKHLSAALQGLPLMVSESYGMRYAVLLGSQNRP
ncbi:MAG TPA: hypothetical protein VMN57_14015 [Anaerolineales bacterium]|nr:hypothetical protein [Anaerolineales bacterium]